MSNTISRLQQRTAKQLNGLIVDILEDSTFTIDVKQTIDVIKYKNISYANYLKIKNRTHGELNGLLYSKIKRYNDDVRLRNKVVITKCPKEHKAKLSVIYSYSLNRRW